MTETATIERAVAPAVSPAIVFEAIVKRQLLTATYNRGEVLLAPHIVFTRHDELYVDAVTVERDGRAPREQKLGTFKLVGLAGARVTPRRFVPSDLFDRADRKYDGVALVTVEHD